MPESVIEKKKKDNDEIILPKKLTKLVAQASHEYGMIQDGDKILLGCSGGKDSLTLAHILKHLQKHAPFNFEFTAVVITYGMGEDYSAQKAHCEKYGIDFEIHETGIFDIAKEKINANSSFCSFFSRMRRGTLYQIAKEKGCNKLALGHHLDDAAESFMMNAMYNGLIRSFPPLVTAKNGITLIRPMTWVRERDLAKTAQDNNLPTVGDEMCPGFRFDVRMPHTRASTKKLLAQIEKDIPNVFSSLKNAMGNIQLEGMLDSQYLK